MIAYKIRRAMQNAAEKLKKCKGRITEEDDCPGCGTPMRFEYLNIPGKQSQFKECWGCGQLLRHERNVKCQD